MMNSYNAPAYFNLPGLFEKYKIYDVLLEIIKKDPTILKDNAIIHSIYGCPHVIWNGGRGVSPSLTLGRQELELVRNRVNRIGIAARFTFTNNSLIDTDVYDTYGNAILDIFGNGKNEVIVNSPILLKYIQDKYPNKYSFVSSTTKRLINKDLETKELYDDTYKYVCLDYDFNKDLEYLDSLTDVSRVEILANPVCKPNCPWRVRHYTDISKGEKFAKFDITSPASNCEDQGKWLEEAKEGKNFVTVEEINDIYLSRGINNFKLEGRSNSSLDLVDILLYYLIKEDKQYAVRKEIYLTLFDRDMSFTAKSCSCQ